jgi:peptide maturation system protein (TIGR04066 family)
VENVNVCGYDIQSFSTSDDYDKIDAVWICDSMGEVSDESLIMVSEEMLSRGKQLIVTRRMDAKIHERISGIAKKYSGTVISYSGNLDSASQNDRLGFLDHIMTPIISVSGPGEHTDKFLTQLLIKEYLERNDKKVALVSSRNNSNLLKGVYSFPDFMSDNISTEHKIIRYNHFVKRIEKEYCPDYIIVGIQGSILPSLNINVWNFELYPYAVFKAVKPLYSIMCLYGNHVSTEYLHELRQIMKYKFDTDVDFFYRSSTTPDLDMVLGSGSKTIESIYANFDETAYIYDDISKICDIILKKI